MSIVKPYTFVAGNKARANEVNEDFDVLYQQVNTNITNIADVEGDIQTLSSTKANVNGDSTQRFAVADPVSSGDAVNKRTLFRQIGNSIDYIGGLTISKDSGSPNDTILIDPGAAYDSTQEVVLKLDVLTSKQNSPQSANTAYYVYIIGSDSGSSIDILISTEPNVPALPTGYTRYRKIGSYTTDSSGNIATIYSLSNSKIITNIDIMKSCAPDYSSVQSRAWNTTYTADSYGWVWASLNTSPGGLTTLTINGTAFTVGRSTKSETAFGSGSMFFVSPSDTYLASGNLDASGHYQLYFIKCKGV